MPTPESSGARSLLPYLNPALPGIALKLDLTDAVLSPEVPMSADPCGPLTTIRSGQIAADGHILVADIMALFQADIYQLKTSELNPLTNLDVEKAWQDAWHNIKNPDASVQKYFKTTVLPCQLDDNGALVPLKPLLYCSHVERYAHPHCPYCGTDLTLCRSEDALSKAGLNAYSGSLQRYLYCRACHQATDEAPFYQYPLPEDPPVRVQGCHALFEDFSRLLTKTELAGDLPCIGCDEAPNCYGADTLVLKRMAVIQFYPFHMLLKNAPALNVLDFLPLLSGASKEEIEQSLVRSQKYSRLHLFRKLGAGLPNEVGLLFAGESRVFAETLYLKLSFIETLLLMVVDGSADPASRMSMEGVGVSLSNSGARLPYLWNFGLTLIDPVGSPAASSISRSQIREFLGRAWFYVLVVNNRQSMEVVRGAIDRLSSENSGSLGVTTIHPDPVFAPGNIFWQAPILELHDDWTSFWQEAIAMGLALLRADLNTGAAANLEDIKLRLAGLKSRVHESLFQSQPAIQTEEKGADHPAGEQIAQILSALLERWLPAAQPQTEAIGVNTPKVPMSASGAQPNEDGDYEETVILSTQADGIIEPEDRSAEPALEKTILITPPAQPSPQPVFDQLDKTVVISTPGPPPLDADGDKTVVIKSSALRAPSDDLEKTVVQSPVSKPPAADDLEKTVLIGGAPIRKAEDDLDKTVVLEPGGHKRASDPGPLPAASKTDEADDLEATVILQPKSGKNRKPKS